MKDRCVLIIRLGRGNDSAYDETWNANPDKFTLNKLPEIIRPLLDDIAEGKRDISSYQLDSSDQNMLRPGFGGTLRTPNKDDATIAIINCSIENENISSNDSEMHSLYYNVGQTRPGVYSTTPICYISIEFAMNAEELSKALNNKKRIDQSLITNIYSNKINGYFVKKSGESNLAYLIPKETVFPEVEHLRHSLDHYLQHLRGNDASDLRDAKMTVIEDMIDILNDPDIMYQDKITAMNNYFSRPNSRTTFLNATPSTILSIDRDPLALRILAGIGHVLTLGIVSKLTRGTFAFWKTHGDVVMDEVHEAVNKHKQ